jgi:hypothetical protein
LNTDFSAEVKQLIPYIFYGCIGGINAPGKDIGVLWQPGGSAGKGRTDDQRGLAHGMDDVASASLIAKVGRAVGSHCR